MPSMAGRPGKKHKRKYTRRQLKVDEVNHPPHYNKGKFETIEVREDIAQFYTPVEATLVSDILRYLSRAPHKDNKKKDLEKAQWYMNRLVSKQG